MVGQSKIGMAWQEILTVQFPAIAHTRPMSS